MHGGSAASHGGPLPRAIPVDLPPEVYSAVHGPSGADDGRDDEFERAMALNEQLKAMLGEDAAATAEQFAASAVGPAGMADENDLGAYGGNQDMEYPLDAPSHGRRARRPTTRTGQRSAGPAAKGPARGPARRKPASYTFGNEKLKEIGRDNRILLEKMARITLEGTGPNAAVAPRAPRKRTVASESINRRRRHDKIANENAVRAAAWQAWSCLPVTMPPSSRRRFRAGHREAPGQREGVVGAEPAQHGPAQEEAQEAAAKHEGAL